MKSKKNKRHIRLTALALTAGSAAAPTSVWAQSSVVLYGILDAGITYVNNAGGSRQLKFDDGISYGNRIGFKGTEDLWGGVKAIFVLESGIKLGTGKLAQGGAEFGRQAYVGLQSQWGTLSAGDQLDLTNVIVEGYNISSFGSGYAIHQGDFDRMNGDRLPNSVKYMSPDFGGLSFGGLYSFGNIAGNFHEQSAYSIGGRYINAGFTAGTAYTRLNSPNGIYAFDPYAMIGTKTMLGQTVSTVNPTTGAVTDLFKSSQFNVDSQESFAIGASYVIGNTMISGNYTYTTIKGYGQSSHMHVGEGGGSYKFTPALILYGGYQFTAFEGHKWNMGSLGLHYFFSKRTDIYMSGDYLSGSNGVDAVIGYSFTPSRSSTQSDLRVGMRHSF